jgi:hypothetical protein
MPLDKTCQYVRWFALARGYKPAELDKVDPALTGLDFCDPTVGHAKPSRQVALRKPCFAANSPQFQAEGTIIGSVG